MNETTQTTSEVDEDAESIEDIPFPPLDPAYGKWILKDYVWDEQWEEADVEFKQVGWKHYEQLLVKRGYKLHLMPKDGAATESMPVIQPPILAPTEDPFHSKDNEILCFAINGRPVGGREFVQPRPNIVPAYDEFEREVVLKAFPSTSHELKILRYLNSPKLRQDKRNRTIPLLDIFRSGDTVFVVMPEWTYASSLGNALNIKEHLEDARQYFEALSFMHEQNVAHRDICGINILGNHALNYLPSFPAAFRSRFNFQIALIDFEFAVYVPASAPNRLAPGKNIGNFLNAPPEAMYDAPYDPFKSDVYAVAKELKLVLDSNNNAWPLLHNRSDTVLKAFRERAPEYLNLLRDMSSELPEHRPSMQEALIRLEEIRSALPEDVLYTPIDTREESTTQKRILSNKKASRRESWCTIM